MTTQLGKHKPKTPRKLNESMILSLTECIRQGSYANVACQMCDISEQTLYNWLNQGELDYNNNIESLQCRLFESIKHAQAESEHDMVKFIRNTSIEKKDPYAAMMYLERRVPERWAKQDRTKIDINNNQNITLTYKHIIQLAREYEKEQAQLIEGECKELPERTEG